MIRVLLAKELRALRPITLCLVALSVVSVLYVLITEPPDAQPLDPAKWVAELRIGAFIMVGVFSLMLGAGVLMHESEEGTLHFLDGLPLSRTRIFCAKALAALLVIALVPLLGFVTEVPFGLMSRTSLDGPFPWTFALAVAGLQVVAGAYLTALAMVVSFVRSWFALVTGLIFFSFLWARSHGVDGLAYFDPHELLAPGLAGGITLPWGHLAAQGGATLVFLFIAWLGFLSLGDRGQFVSERLGRRRALRALGSGLKLLAPVIWFAAIFQVIRGLDTDDAGAAERPVGEDAFARRETEHFDFLFRSVQWEDATELIDVADEIHDEVAAFLHAPPPPARIVVDLASPVLPHAAGQTHWTKIRLPISPGQELAEQRQILAHEVAHVFIEQLGGGRLTPHFASVRALHEGLATYIEQMIEATPEQRTQQRRAVAGAWSRGRVPFILLADNDALLRQRDLTLAYPLGAELARALIETQGPEAPARLIRALGRPGAPSGLAGAALWRDAMQAAGLSFERMVAAYESACAESAVAEKDFIASLPRLTAEVTVAGEEIVVRPKFTGAEPGEIVCVIEDDQPYSTGIQFLARRADGVFVLTRARHLKTTLRYLLGWRTPATELPVFEPWAEATLP